MGLTESVKTVLTKKYATFSGRASRSEFWWFQLFYWVVLAVISFLSAALGGALTASSYSQLNYLILIPVGIVILALLVPFLALQVRRFHDRNLSGWWYLAAIILSNIPFIGIIAAITIFVISLLKGTEGSNRFGPDPLRSETSAEIFA